MNNKKIVFSATIFAVALLLFSGFAVALSEGANIISCQETDYFTQVSTPYGENNVTIKVWNDKCTYYGPYGNVTTNVSFSDTLGTTLSDANFSQWLSASSLGTALNLTIYYSPDSGATWQLIQNVSYGNNTIYNLNTSTFNWAQNTNKTFRVTYYASSQEPIKFNISNTINFTPVINSTYASSKTSIKSAALTNNTINYTGKAGDLGNPIIFIDNGTARYFWHTNSTANLAYAYSSSTGINFTQVGACQALYETAPAAFNTTNKTIANGTVYCFPIMNATGDYVAYTVVNVSNVTVTADPTTSWIDYAARMEAGRQYLTPENDPYFDPSLHTVQLYVTGASGAAAAGQTVALYNSSAWNATAYNTTTTNAAGYVAYLNLPSEIYSIYVYNYSKAAYNATSLNNLLNSTTEIGTITITGYDNLAPYFTIIKPTNYVNTSTLGPNVTFTSNGSSLLNYLNINVTIWNTTNVFQFNGTNMTCATSGASNTSINCFNSTFGLAAGYLLSAGTYNLSAAIGDFAGKTNTTTLTSFIFDKTAPVNASSQINRSQGGLTNYYGFNVTFTEGGSGIASATALMFNDSSTKTCTLTEVTTNVWGCNDQLMPAVGNYSINITAYDNALNSLTNATLTTYFEVLNYSYALVNYSTTQSELSGSITANVSGFAYWAYANGTSNGTALEGTDTVTISGCTGLSVPDSIDTSTTGYFTATIHTSSSCTLVTTIAGTNVSQSTALTLANVGNQGNTGTSGTYVAPTIPQTTATPAPSSTPIPTPEPSAPQETEQVDSSTSVVGTFGATSTSFTVSYSAGSSGYTGGLTFELPLNYQDYVAGLVQITPTPDRVEAGSVKAIYDSVDLAANQEFKVNVVVAKKIASTILKDFTAPTTQPAQPTATTTPTVAPTKTPTATAEPTTVKAGFDYTWVIILVIVIVIIGVAARAMRKPKGL